MYADLTESLLDDALLKNKAYKEVMQKLTVRITKVREFLSLFRPGIIYDIVPIDDVYGPTGWDPNVQALVVSRETMSGAEASAYTLPPSLPPPPRNDQLTKMDSP